jgi:hypothetical protein
MLKPTTIAGAVAALVAAPAYFFYIRGIRKGHTIPNLATWITWSVVGWIIFSSYVVTGARDSAMTTFVYALGPPTVLAFIYKNGKTKFALKDKLFLVASLSGCVLWGVFHSSLIALYINIAVDAGAAVPTIVDTWKKPEEEDKPTWIFSTAATVINLFAVEQWVSPTLWLYPATWAKREFAVCIYPVILVAMCATIMTLALLRPDSRLRNAAAKLGDTQT